MRNHIDYRLMRSIAESCGAEIDRAAKGDIVRCSVLAALAANGSGGSPKAYRFSPTLYEALAQRLQGGRSSTPLVPRRDLERYLRKYSKQVSEEKLLRGLAAFQGYTLIGGFHCVRWSVPLQELVDKSSHFRLADRLIGEHCSQRDLKLERDLATVGHLWTAGRGLRHSGVSMYVGRLRMRFDVYRWILTQERDRAA